MVSKRQFLSAIWLVVVLLLVGCATADPAPTPTPETISIAATRTTTFVPPTSTPLLATPTSTEYDMVSPRFGLFQWAHDGSGLYVLDGSANTEGHEIDYLINNKVHYADFYYIDLTQEKHPEQKLGGDIPLDLPYSGAWAYSPEINAMAGTFELNGPVFAVLFLE